MRKTTTPTTDPTVARSGVVVVDKPTGWTSHQVVARMRKLAGTRKVGHAGTLDPMATGVLVVGIERATRLLGHLTLTDKEYLATIRLGVATVSDDAEGEVTGTVDAGQVTTELVEAQLDAFRGDIRQTPSSVSAIKIGGVRSYARVRAGQDVALPSRPVTVSRYDILDLRSVPAASEPAGPANAVDRDVVNVDVVDVDVVVECSSGTYVRALARDLGLALGVGGHLTALRRTRVGPFTLTAAQTLEQAAEGLAIVDIADVARLGFKTLVLDDEQAERVTHGRRLLQVALPAPTTALLTRQGEFLALYRPEAGDAVAVSVFTA